MKRFLIKVSVFLIGLVMFDFTVGMCCRYLVNHAKGGDTGLNNYICHKMTEEFLIFGSSRGMHHYDPSIITDSLNMSCWNCAKDGNGIILMYGRYHMLSARYAPKVLVYDVCPEFDLFEGDNHKYLGGLRYYYDEPGVDSIFWAVDKKERAKMLSSCYRYNSQWLQLISDNIHPLQSDDKGYRPMDKQMTYVPEKRQESEEPQYKYDALKFHYLERLIEECNQRGTKLVFAISPSFGADDDRGYNPLKELCARYDIPLINHFCDPEFTSSTEYFYDSVHLNRTGATKYTKKLMGELKELLGQE